MSKQKMNTARRSPRRFRNSLIWGALTAALGGALAVGTGCDQLPSSESPAGVLAAGMGRSEAAAVQSAPPKESQRAWWWWYPPPRK